MTHRFRMTDAGTAVLLALMMAWLAPGTAAAAPGPGPLCGQVTGPSDLGSMAEEGADRATQLWRAGDSAGASALWEAALVAEPALPDAERARLCFNLGVAASDAGEDLEAVAWLEAARRLSPRDADVRTNLDIARADAGLSPLRSGDLGETLRGLIADWTPGEAGWLAALGVVLLLLVGLPAALRGGGWVRGVRIVAALQVVLFAPLLWHVFSSGGQPHMVIDGGGASVYSRPSPGSERLGTLGAGETVESLDGITGWIKVDHAGEARWVRAAALVPLRR